MQIENLSWKPCMVWEIINYFSCYVLSCSIDITLSEGISLFVERLQRSGPEFSQKHVRWKVGQFCIIVELLHVIQIYVLLWNRPICILASSFQLVFNLLMVFAEWVVCTVWWFIQESLGRGCCRVWERWYVKSACRHFFKGFNSMWNFYIKA